MEKGEPEKRSVGRPPLPMPEPIPDTSETARQPRHAPNAVERDEGTRSALPSI